MLGKVLVYFRDNTLKTKSDKIIAWCYTKYKIHKIKNIGLDFRFDKDLLTMLLFKELSKINSLF